MNICIASDHAGFSKKEILKKYLNEKKHSVVDFGTFSEDPVDYPDFAHKVGKAINDGIFELGIVLCGSGNGVNMVVNKYLNVRSALCWNEKIAMLAKEHNDANVIAIPALFLSEHELRNIIDAFLNSTFKMGRHERRIKKIKDIL